MPRPSRATVRAAISLVVLIAVVVVTIVRLHPPADGEGIDADRVRAFLRRIAAEPHPAGSEANARLRTWLVEHLTDLGWSVTTQSGALPHWRFEDEIVPLTNITARLDGTADTAGSLLLVAHYDSRPGGSHGAGDDGTGVAALLEVATQFAADPPRNDVIILLTDAEEAGLLGARWWVQETAPDYMDARAVLNFEGRGASGPAVMFETGPDDAWLVDQFARSAPHPVTTSLAPAIYERLPNATDFTVFTSDAANLPHGVRASEAVRASPPNLPGLNFAFIGGYERYHTPEDDIEHLSDRTLLHQASQAVAVSRQLAEADLTRARGPSDAIYFDVWSLGVVRYPAVWRWPVLAGALLLAGAGIATASRGAGSWKAWLWSAAALLAAFVGVVAWVQLVAWFLPHPQAGRWYEVAFAGMALLAAGAAGLLGASAERKRRVLMVWTAVLALLAVAATIWLPGGSYLPVIATAAGGLALLTHNSRAWPVGLVGVVAATVVLTFAAWMIGLAVTLQLAGVPAALLLAMLLLWLPFVPLRLHGAGRALPRSPPARSDEKRQEVSKTAPFEFDSVVFATFRVHGRILRVLRRVLLRGQNVPRGTFSDPAAGPQPPPRAPIEGGHPRPPLRRSRAG